MGMPDLWCPHCDRTWLPRELSAAVSTGGAGEARYKPCPSCRRPLRLLYPNLPDRRRRFNTDWMLGDKPWEK